MVRMADRLPVSVVIPAYDRAAVVDRAIASARAQSPAPPAELIVVDDGSRDATAEVAAGLGVRVIHHETNAGTAAARNSGVAAATQPWVALLDSDDLWLPHHLDALWRMRNGYVLVANSALRCGRDPRDDRLHGVSGSTPSILADPGMLIYPGNIIPASAAMVQRDVIATVGGFQPPDGLEDLDLWIRVLEHGSGAVSPRIGTIYRVHGQQTSQRVDAMQRNHLAVADRYRDRAWWSPALVERWRGLAAWNNVRTSLRQRRPVDAMRIALGISAHPQRLVGAVGASHRRRRMRRAAARVSRDDWPTVAKALGGYGGPAAPSVELVGPAP